MTSRQDRQLSRRGLRASLLERLRTSFWFLPTLLSLAALGLVTLTVHLDRREALADLFPSWAEDAALDAARALLSGIAGSTITIATVSFSVLIVALSFASQQLGPRLLRNFIRDRANQVVLGGFVATHVYCLALLTSLAALESLDGAFVPRLSMAGALVLGLLSFGLLIYFVHHVAVGIQTDTVVADVRRHLSRAIDAFLPDEGDEGEGSDDDATEPPDEAFLDAAGRDDSDVLRAGTTGYVQAIDYEALARVARRGGGRIGCPVRAGAFVMESSPIVTGLDVLDADEPEEELRAAFSIGFQRTDAQDLAYSFDQLVEIALRALSPGINDPFTALTCLDDIGAALARVADRPFLPACVKDDEGAVRVVRDVLRFEDLVRDGPGEIRRAAGSHLSVVARLLRVLGDLRGVARCEERRALLEEEARAAAEAAFARDLPAPDRRWIETALEEAIG